MKNDTTHPRNSRPTYTVSPCYRLVLPQDEPTRERSQERRRDTPRGSAVRRHTLPW
ncbi:MAG: hypothetical protein KDA24_12920 [Deltaproteobacteria bacterium]|nr:hypothetical protein [Deltaproteobacteria bacterium]